MVEFPADMSPRDEVAPHRQVADRLEDAIRAGEYPPGRALPSETELMGMTGLGRNAVRRAIALLRKRGLARTVPKRGTYVASDIPPPGDGPG